MHKVIVDIPSRPGVSRDQFGPAYSSLCDCLASCLPLLTAAKNYTRPDQSGHIVSSLQLTFASERHWEFAQMSKEWMDLIDATSPLLDWDSASHLTAGATPLMNQPALAS
jgi:hypothetical protein